LFNQISESFADIESKVFEEKAEKTARKLLFLPTLLFVLQIIFVIGNFVFTNNIILPLYKPEVLQNNIIITWIYNYFQFLSIMVGFVVYSALKLVSTSFLIYLMELSKFIGQKFGEMATKKT
jgi:hypothetical protein